MRHAAANASSASATSRSTARSSRLALPAEPGTPDRRNPRHARLALVRNREPGSVLFCRRARASRASARRLPIAFARLTVHARTTQLRAAIEARRPSAHVRPRGRLVDRRRPYLSCDRNDGGLRIPVLRNALAAAARARLVLTIPGTKTIELAVLGKPTVAITPLNAPEVVTINGPLTYLDRIPLRRHSAQTCRRARRCAPIQVLHAAEHRCGSDADSRSPRNGYAGTHRARRAGALRRSARGSPQVGERARAALSRPRRRVAIAWPMRCSSWLRSEEAPVRMDFSVVIATKDRARYLECALASLLAQTRRAAVRNHRRR